ncbi:MAG: lyase family protein [Balneolaceae bacterium]
MAKLWSTGKEAASEEVSRRVEQFTVGNDHLLDRELLPWDLKASAIHAEALSDAGVLSKKELTDLKKGLEEIGRLWESGRFEILPEYEDGHTAIEVWLTEKLGEAGRKIHTGRSRNDQVLTAMRLYEKHKLSEILKQTAGLAEDLLKAGSDHSGIPMPGFTHTRRAMLSSVGQWAGGYAELLILQLEASAGVASLTDRSPLGTAAGFGTTFDLDRTREAESLGFRGPLICATTAQLSRGWVELQLVDYLAAITLVLNRFASDVITFSSEAYGYFELDEAVCTGSSIMPQKRNPDLAELIRGKHSLITGYAATLRSLVQQLGSGYHRDLQLSKEPVIRVFSVAEEMIDATRLLLEHTRFNAKVLTAACSSDIQAAEAANRLVREEGLSFREAYLRVKEGGESGSDSNPADLLKEYSQLGSPGNPGLELLSERLKRFSIRS